MKFEALAGYKPVKVENGVAPIKGNFTCQVNKAMISPYEGDKEELKGVNFFEYELEIINDETYAGRRFWKRFNLSDEKGLKKLADQMFTLGLEFDSEELLGECAEKFANLLVKVNAWIWDNKEKGEKVQQHIIKGIAEEINPKTTPSF